VAQQNEINASLLHSLQLLSQELALLRHQSLTQEQTLHARISALEQMLEQLQRD